MQSQWRSRGNWSAEDWSLGLTVFRDGHPIGSVTLAASEFGVRREVRTASWLGIEHQRQGFGTEARIGVLTLAFDHLGAEYATSEVFPDNAASQGVSRRLGYEHDGISRDVRDGEVVVSDRLRLTRERWATVDRSGVEVTGVGRCRAMFGVSR